MGEFPTQKQENFAKDIADALGIDLPKMRTKQAYSHFINENINAFKREQQSFSVSDLDDADYWDNY